MRPPTPPPAMATLSGRPGRAGRPRSSEEVEIELSGASATAAPLTSPLVAIRRALKVAVFDTEAWWVEVRDGAKPQPTAADETAITHEMDSFIVVFFGTIDKNGE